LSGPREAKAGEFDEAPAPPPASRWDDARAAFALVTLAVLAVQAIQVSLLWGDPSVTGPIIDSWDFHLEASRIAAGAAPPPTPNFQSPLFPWALALVYRLLGSRPSNGLILQAAVSLVIAWEVLALGRRWLRPGAALCAGLAAAAYGPLLFFDGQLTSAPLDAATALGALLIASRTTGRSGWLAQLGLGVMTGIAIATRGTIAPFVLYLWARPLLSKQTRLRDGAGRAAAAGIGVVLGLLPVAVSNWLRCGAFSAVTSNAGINLWLGNNPDFRATTALRPGHAWDHLFTEPARHGAIEPLAQSAYFRDRALSWVVHHPLDALAAFAVKLGDLLNGLEVPRNLDPYGALAHTPVTGALLWEAPLLRFPFGLVLPLALLGLALRWRSGDERLRRQAHTTAAFVGLNALGVCLFFPCGRYRLAIALALLTPMIDGACWLRARLRSRSRHAIPSPVLIGVGVVTLWANLAPQLTGPRLAGEGRAQRMWTDVAAGRWEEAERGAEALLAARPDDADAWRVLGDVRARQGRQDSAAEAFRHALALVPDYLQAWQQLGAIRLAQRRYGEAIPALEAVLREDPAQVGAWVDLTEACLLDEDLPGALRAGHEASRLAPASSKGWLYLGMALNQSGDAKNAEPALRRSIALNNNSATARYQLALALAELGRRDEALRSAREALEHAPQHRGAQALIDRLEHPM
jgi:cytochrome c-type biogenesis protein CcmH/NrfG